MNGDDKGKAEAFGDPMQFGDAVYNLYNYLKNQHGNEEPKKPIGKVPPLSVPPGELSKHDLNEIIMGITPLGEGFEPILQAMNLAKPIVKLGSEAMSEGAKQLIERYKPKDMPEFSLHPDIYKDQTLLKKFKDYFNDGKDYQEGHIGMLEPGNIDLASRPKVKNPDGSWSTVKTITIDQDGKTILLPTIINGKLVSNEDAIEHFRKTGEHLGMFKDQKSADAYDKKMHEKMNWKGKRNVWDKEGQSNLLDSLLKMLEPESPQMEYATKYGVNIGG